VVDTDTLTDYVGVYNVLRKKLLLSSLRTKKHLEL
jgi:hypothetical protein